jgi:hypothetical protein
MRKIAFIIDYNPSKWLGGVYVILNLIRCLEKFSKNKIKPVLVVNKKLEKNEEKIFRNYKLLKTDLFNNRNLFFKIFSKLNILIFGKFYQYENFFLREKIDFVSHVNVFNSNIFFGKKSLVKTLSFIPDLQHIHLKENFSLKKRLMRNLNIYLCGLFSSKILLSSLDTKKDIKKVSNVAYENSEISRFIFETPRKNDILSLKQLQKKYKFSGDYFYLPNQYWVHKNHEVVLRALTLLKRKSEIKKILIISSGNSDDHRNPQHFKKIKEYIHMNKLDNSYIYIGTVPHADVLSLMFHSKAVINPSKFEGRSSTVEQAKSLGKMVILSNLKIHKEQNPAMCMFFNADDHHKLSYLLLKVAKMKIKKNIFSVFSKQNKICFEKYYEEYMSIINSLT